VQKGNHLSRRVECADSLEGFQPRAEDEPVLWFQDIVLTATASSTAWKVSRSLLHGKRRPKHGVSLSRPEEIHTKIRENYCRNL
jgi:hypothetical protein